MQLQGARGATFSAANAFFNTQILANQTGGKVEAITAETFDKYDICTVKSETTGEGENVIIRDYENDFLLAHCELDENSGKTRLLNSTRWFENSCSGIYGVLVSVMRFQFDMN